MRCAYRLCRIDHGCLVSLLLLGVLARLLRHEAPKLVEVDGWAPLGVGLQVEVSDSLLSEHSRVAIQENKYTVSKQSKDERAALTISENGFSGGGSHRPFRVRLGAFGAFQYDHGRSRRGRASCGSS